MHPSLEPIRFLLGTWHGEGEGRFHTVDPFSYREEIQFRHQGGPLLAYHQRARSKDDGELLHTEMGFWRMFDDGSLNAFISLTAGTDLSEGTVQGTSIRLATRTAPMAAGVERVTRLERRYDADGELLTYEILMGTDEEPFGRHIWGSLSRVPGGATS